MNTTKDIPLDRVRAHWERAGRYPANKETVYPGHAEANGFEEGRGKRVLEYGCGGGADAMSYLRRDAEVVYVDITHENVQAAGARIEAAGLALRARGVALDASASIPEPDASFDIVSSHGVLHHIVDAVPVLHEFHRILKPGGLLFVMLYTEHLERKFARRIAELQQRVHISKEEAFGWCTDEEGTPYARSYTPSEGEEFLKAGGFKLVSTYDYNGGDFRTFKAVKA